VSHGPRNVKSRPLSILFFYLLWLVLIGLVSPNMGSLSSRVHGFEMT
jgi:hypothetical protein